LHIPDPLRMVVFMADIDQLFPTLEPAERCRSNLMAPMESRTNRTYRGDRVGVPLDLPPLRVSEQPRRRCKPKPKRKVVKAGVTVDGVLLTLTAAAAAERTLAEQVEHDAKRHMAESRARGGGD